MLNEIAGLYLADKYNIMTDRILFTETISANDTTAFSLVNATNGAKLKSDLYSLDYFITKYSIWSQNGILDVTIKPDDESTNQLKTQAFTQKTDASILPLKHIRTDLTIEVTNNQGIDDDLFLALEIFKLPQNRVAELIDLGKILCVSLDNIDLQTLAIERFLIYTNELLKALILANNGKIPDTPTSAVVSSLISSVTETQAPSPSTRSCRRT